MTEPVYGPEVYSQKLVSQAKVRKFASQHGHGYLSIGIIDADRDPVDPDNNLVRLKLWVNTLADPLDEGTRGALVLDTGAPNTPDPVRDDVGMFHFDVGPAYTRQRGLISAEWTYTVGGTAFTFNDDMQVLEQMPNYDSLSDESRLMVEQASWFFADLFDSTTGGPWLQENFQTHFTYDRLAFLLRMATMKFNVLGYPVTSYGVEQGGGSQVPKNYTDLLLWGTKLEAIRHLITSYTEQPDFRNIATTYTDRRDYTQRWREVWADEKPDYEKAVKMAKRSLLRLGRGSLLVSGGIYGGGARGIYVPGLFTAMTRSMRFYPAAPSVSWGGQALGQPW
jgi:hypothetical protein